MRTNIKRYIRHPQLTGTAAWAAGHLLSNGEPRSLVRFGRLGLWTLAATSFINRRDGKWRKPEPRPMLGEWRPVATAIALLAVLRLLHPFFTGAPLGPLG